MLSSLPKVNKWLAGARIQSQAGESESSVFNDHIETPLLSPQPIARDTTCNPCVIPLTSQAN